MVASERRPVRILQSVNCIDYTGGREPVRKILPGRVHHAVLPVAGLYSPRFFRLQVLLR
ncbi:MAG: hypothetical protein RLZZ129_2229 [Verrucomicrobiota bacterium]|jgi:hypothetical protein